VASGTLAFFGVPLCLFRARRP